MSDRSHIRDDLLIRNERIKLASSFLNAIGLGLIGFAILRPLTEVVGLSTVSALSWGTTGLVFHGLSHYILGYLKKEAEHDFV